MFSSKTISLNGQDCYFVTLETVDMIDIFTRPVYKQIVIHTLNYFIENKNIFVYGWSLMPNCFYLIMQPKGEERIDEFLQNFQQFTSEKIIETIHSEPDERKIWMLRSFEKSFGLFPHQKKYDCWKQMRNPVPIDTFKSETIAEHLEFIHNEPVKERFVQYPSDFFYSSAKDYADGINGPVKITKLSAVEEALSDIENRKSDFKIKYSSR
jgi:hypothetical protein